MSQQIARDRTMILPAGAAVLARLVRDAYRSSARDGILMPPAVRALLANLDQTATCGHADVRNLAAGTAWDPHDEISTQEASEMLGISDRSVRRYVERGLLEPSRKIGGRRLVVSRAAVRALVTIRIEGPAT